MARFHECLISARDQGEISDEEARHLIAIYERRMALDADELKAKAEVQETLIREAERKERSARITAERLEVLRDVLADGPNMLRQAMGVLDNRNNNLVGAVSVTGRRDALTGYAHGRLEQMLHEFRRKAALGGRRGRATMDDMVSEAFGEGTGNAAAREFVTAWRGVADELLDRFNAAGGDVPKLKDYFPQTHDAGKMNAARKDAWVQFITPRLDPAKMLDPLTGKPITPDRLAESLSVVFDRIVTDGWSDFQPSMQPRGRGSLANQRQEHRFLVFKDAAAWREYNAAFGNGDVFQALTGHLSGLAKDVAALEVLGPNPNATVSWMREMVRADHARNLLDNPTARGVENKTPDEPLGRLWTVVNGTAGVGSQTWADGLQAARNWLTAAQLSGTFLTALLGDPWQQRNAKAFAGVSQLRVLADLPRQLFSGASKREITRAGVIMQDALDNLTMDLRGRSLTNASAELSKWLPDRVFQWTGLQPWTQANRRSQAMSFMFEAGDRVGQSLDEIAKDGVKGERFARWLQGFGVGREEWDLIRQAKPLDHGEAGGMLRMMEIIDSAPGDARVMEAALRYSDAVHAMMEEAVPQGTATARSMLSRATPAGTVGGEFARSASQYLTYPATVMLSNIRAVQHEIAAGGRARGMAYATSAMIALTIGGAMVLQMGELRNGRDPKDMANAEFWFLALAKGGGLGYYGDYVFADYRRGYAEQAAKLAGPLPNAVAEAVAIAAPRALLGEEDINRSRRGLEFARKMTPVQNMWMVRPISERLVWDQLMMIADPQAMRNWARKERQLIRDEGQGVWWGRGEIAPRRAPDFGTAWQ